MITYLNLEDPKEYGEVLEFLDQNSYKHYMQNPNWIYLKGGQYLKDKFCIYSKDNSGFNYYCNAFVKNKNGIKLLYIPRGPILDYSNLANINLFLKDIKTLLVKLNIDEVVLSPMAFENIMKQKLVVVNEGNYALQEHSQKECIVNLKSNLVDTLNGLSSKTRCNIKLSQKFNFKCEINQNFDLKEFYNLYNQTSKKHNFNKNTLEYFEKMLSLYKNDLILIQIKDDNEIISSGIYIKSGSVLYYAYGSTNYNYGNKMVSYLMHYKAIEYAILNNFKYFNMGGVYCDDNVDDPDYGLYRYKKGFCNNKFTYYIGDLSYKIKHP